MDDVFKALYDTVFDLWKEEGLLDEKIEIRAKALSAEEAIGKPEHHDFPIQKGKEKLMQATFKGSPGQAFTDMYGDYQGTLEGILDLPMENNHQRAVFVAALNAVLRHLGRIGGTIHCKDQGPGECGKALLPFILQEPRGRKVALVGFQPRMAENLAGKVSLRVLDMDPDNVGREKFGVTIESAAKTEDAVLWADQLLVTGTTLVNGTISRFMGKTPAIFYGTTIAGAAFLMGWERYCPKSL